jgi:hypothetical protein
MAWLSLFGVENKDLEIRVEKRVQQRVASGDYKLTDAMYLEQHKLRELEGPLVAEGLILEGIRKMAQAWDVQLVPPSITSHRRFTGPLIVGIKRMVFPVLALLLRDQLHKQRDFNARTLEVILLMQKKR